MTMSGSADAREYSHNGQKVRSGESALAQQDSKSIPRPVDHAIEMPLAESKFATQIVLVLLVQIEPDEWLPFASRCDLAQQLGDQTRPLGAFDQLRGTAAGVRIHHLFSPGP